MCGLIFAARYDSKRTGGTIQAQYQKQRTRGTRGFGIVAAAGGKLERYERTDVEGDVKKLLKGNYDFALFHHRFPTSAENLPETAHPIKVDNRELSTVYYVAHNGHVSNSAELKTRHERLGYEYNTEIRTIIETKGKRYDFGTEWNDSESLAIDVARFLSGKQDDIESEGTIAFIALEFKHSGEFVALHYGRGMSPLKLVRNKRMWMLASEADGEDVAMNKVYTWNGKETTERPAALGGVLYTPPTTYGYRLPVSQPIGQHWSAAASLPKGDKTDETKARVVETMAALQKQIERMEFDIAAAEARGFTGYAARLRLEKEAAEDRLDILTYESYGIA